MNKLLIVGCAAAVVALNAAAVGAAKPRFAANVDNPWFPLTPGTTYVYRGTKDGKHARDVVTITHQTRVIHGARCVVVRDVLYLGRRLAERTTDWYSQDARGNVWYFGEDRGIRRKASCGQERELDRGQGRRQSRHLHASAPARRAVGAAGAKALLTEEWTPLEPGVLDRKYYVRGIGTVREQSVKGPLERLELLRVKR